MAFVNSSIALLNKNSALNSKAADILGRTWSEGCELTSVLVDLFLDFLTFMINYKDKIRSTAKNLSKIPNHQFRMMVLRTIWSFISSCRNNKVFTHVLLFPE